MMKDTNKKCLWFQIDVPEDLTLRLNGVQTSPMTKLAKLTASELRELNEPAGFYTKLHTLEPYNSGPSKNSSSSRPLKVDSLLEDLTLKTFKKKLSNLPCPKVRTRTNNPSGVIARSSFAGP